MARLQGMTGFARASREGPFGTAAVEARSVNGKGLDARVRLPQGLDRLEAEIRNRVKSAFARGSVSLSVTLDRAGGAEMVRIDETLLERLAKTGRKLVDQGYVQPPRLDGLLAIRGVVLTEEGGGEDQDEAVEAAVLGAVDDALAGLKAAREDEGAALAALLTAQVDEIEALTAKAVAHTASRAEAIRDRIKAKFDELLPQGLDEERLAQEAAALAVRADVREELDRLSAHVDAARKLIEGGSPAGRKLDFLTQEFNREANTLCSKAADRELTDLGLSLKHVVDQLREQVQNVE